MDSNTALPGASDQPDIVWNEWEQQNSSVITDTFFGWSQFTLDSHLPPRPLLPTLYLVGYEESRGYFDQQRFRR